jgi:hypothetical protein
MLGPGQAGSDRAIPATGGDSDRYFSVGSALRTAPEPTVPTAALSGAVKFATDSDGPDGAARPGFRGRWCRLATRLTARLRVAAGATGRASGPWSPLRYDAVESGVSRSSSKKRITVRMPVS